MILKNNGPQRLVCFMYMTSHMTIIFKCYWRIYQISGDRLQDLWSSYLLCEPYSQKLSSEFGLMPVFSSPEPLGSQGELIGWP